MTLQEYTEHLERDTRKMQAYQKELARRTNTKANISMVIGVLGIIGMITLAVLTDSDS